MDWRGVGSNPAGDIYFHFEFFAPSPFRTGQRSRCKWNQACPFTWSHSCFRPQIWFIIQGLVYKYLQYSFKEQVNEIAEATQQSTKSGRLHLSYNDNKIGMHDPCDKPFLFVPWGDLDLWPTSRSNLLLGGGPQFFEFACIFINSRNHLHFWCLTYFTSTTVIVSTLHQRDSTSCIIKTIVQANILLFWNWKPRAWEIFGIMNGVLENRLAWCHVVSSLWITCMTYITFGNLFLYFYEHGYTDNTKFFSLNQL